MKHFAFLGLFLGVVSGMQANACSISNLDSKIKSAVIDTIRDEARKRNIPFDQSTLTFAPTVSFKVGNISISVVSPKGGSPYAAQLNYTTWENAREVRDSMGNICGETCQANASGSFLLRNDHTDAIISDYREYSILENHDDVNRCN